IREFCTAINLDPKDPRPHNNLGCALHDKKQLDEAIREYRTAIDLDPNLALAHNNLGAALDAQGKPVEAVPEYLEALRLERDDRWAPEPLRDPLWRLAAFPDPDSPNPKRTVDLAQQSAELLPKDGTIRLALGVAQHRAGDCQAARENIEKAMSLRNGGDP